MNDHKIFVLDTSVILHDHKVLDSFEEHDVAIPLTVLEELDKFKKGNAVLNRNAREFIRGLDALSGDNLLQDWIPFNGGDRGRLRVIPPSIATKSRALGFSGSQTDHLILGAAIGLKADHEGRRVILVSKDINLRLKARALEPQAEDYKRVQIRDIDDLYRGTSRVEVEDPAIIDRIHAEGSVAPDGLIDEIVPQHYFVMTAGDRSALAWANPATGMLERITTKAAYRIRPRNVEQTFALHAILEPSTKLVSLSGPAGTGKTVLALAGALEQSRNYRQVFLARPIVPLSNKDIGFLPGDAQSKIDPYMQPLWDNLGLIKSGSNRRTPPTAGSRKWSSTRSCRSCRWPISAVGASPAFSSSSTRPRI